MTAVLTLLAPETPVAPPTPPGAAGPSPLDTALARIASALQLHRPVEVHHVRNYGQGPYEEDRVSYICAECSDAETVIAAESAGELPYWAKVERDAIAYPCVTAIALGVAP